MLRRSLPRPLLAALALGLSLAMASPHAGIAKDGGRSDGGGGGSHSSRDSGSSHGGGDDHGGSDHGGGDDHGGDDHSGDDHGDDHGGGGDNGGGRGSGRNSGGGGGQWDNSGSREARGAVSSGKALPLARVMPVVRQAVPGRVLEVDMERVLGGGWMYKFLVLSNGGLYSEVTVDALRNRIVRIRER